jgi:hypothetical protein
MMRTMQVSGLSLESTVLLIAYRLHLEVKDAVVNNKSFSRYW